MTTFTELQRRESRRLAARLKHKPDHMARCREIKITCQRCDKVQVRFNTGLTRYCSQCSVIVNSENKKRFYQQFKATLPPTNKRLREERRAATREKSMADVKIPDVPDGFTLHPVYRYLACNKEGVILRIDVRYRSLRWRECPGSKDSAGYTQYSFGKDKIRGHRLVWETFNGVYSYSTKTGDGMTIDHINAIKSDNRLDNLQLISHRENTRRANCKYNLPEFISWHKKSRIYVIRANVNGKRFSSKQYRSLADALDARDEFLISVGYKGFVA